MYTFETFLDHNESYIGSYILYQKLQTNSFSFA